MHWEIGRARGQLVLQAILFAKNGIVRLEAEVVYSEHIYSGKTLYY